MSVSLARSTTLTEDAPPEWALGAAFLDELADYYAELLATAFIEAVDVDELVKAYMDTVPAEETVHAARTPARLGGIVPPLDLITEQTLDVLREAWMEGYVTGTETADELLADVGIPVRERPWDASVDWEDWVPGDTIAAGELAGTTGRGLNVLLDQAEVTIRGIERTTVDRIGTALGEAVARGEGVEQAGRRIEDLLGDRERARLIAQTEIARAMTVATLDSYADYGIPEVRFLLSAGACPKCRENAAAGAIPITQDFPNGYPPVHPRCVCAVAPVVSPDLLQAHEDGTAPTPDSPAADLDELGPSIADRFDMSQAARARYGDTLEALDELHRLPQWESAVGDPVADARAAALRDTRVSFKTGSASGKGGHFTPHSGFIGKVEIRVNRSKYAGDFAANDLISLLHETGHWMDWMAGGGQYVTRASAQLSNLASPAMHSFLEAVKQTEAYLRSVEGMPRGDRRNYVLSPIELWARAYSEWTAEQIGGEAAAQLAAYRAGYGVGSTYTDLTGEAYAWSETDAATLAPYIEGVLREWGVLP